MSDIKYIMAQVFMAGLYPSGLLCSNPSAKQAVSANSLVEGEEWSVPFIENGVFDRYDRVIQTDRPTDDAVRTVRLREPNTGATIWILGTVGDWVDRVNACCGDTPEMPDQVVPDPMLEEFPCQVVVCTPETGTYTFMDVLPVLTTGQAYLLSGSANGVAFTPAAPAAGFTTMAAALAWAQANWGAYGTWSLSDTDGLTLVSTTVSRGGLSVKVKPAGSIATLGAITGGAGYVNAVYPAVPLTGGTGNGATANITVAGGAVTVVTLVNRGKGYTVADALSAAAVNLGGTGAGFSVPVATVQPGAA